MTGGVLVAGVGAALAAVGILFRSDIPGNGMLLSLPGGALFVIGVVIGWREISVYKAQRRHIDSKRQPKLDVPATGRTLRDQKNDDRIDAFLDS